MWSSYDGNIGQFTINESYISLYQQLLMLAFAFYFGGRSVEKLAAIGKDVIGDRQKRRRKKDSDTI